jgi:thymidylate synthase ThyX
MLGARWCGEDQLIGWATAEDAGGAIIPPMITSAKVIDDSVTRFGHRLTTMEVTLHRFVLAEFNTHRAFSRNSASSRAIPVGKQLERVVKSPAFPLEWPSEQPGMQGGVPLEGEALEDAERLFFDAWYHTAYLVGKYLEEHPEKSDRLHKSLINRLLEPFMWHTIIVSATEWDNFFKQRCSPLAQPEIRVAAELMEQEFNSSEPRLIEDGDWHTPYIQDDERGLPLETRKQISVARCARVSYLTHDGVRDLEKDVELYERLVSSLPPHWSPLEHVARPKKYAGDEGSAITLGNFTGWVQMRHDR